MISMSPASLRNSEPAEGGSTQPLAHAFVRSQAVVSRQIAGETLIVPVRGKVGDLASIYSFNRTGTLIWKLLAAPRDVAELAAAVEQEYDVSPGQAQKDVEQFLNDMFSAGLVEIPGPAVVPGIAPVGRAGPEAAGAK